MSRILALIAAAGLLSIAACQSAPEQAAQAKEKPAAQTATGLAVAPDDTALAAEPVPAREVTAESRSQPKETGSKERGRGRGTSAAIPMTF